MGYVYQQGRVLATMLEFYLPYLPRTLSETGILFQLLLYSEESNDFLYYLVLLPWVILGPGLLATAFTS